VGRARRRLARRYVQLAAIAALTALAAGCGGGSGSSTTSTAATSTRAVPPAPPVPGVRTPAERRLAAVILAWSTRLNNNDDAGIARLYALPTIIVQGPYAYRLTTRRQVARWYSLLPCAGKVLSISFHGRFATAVFRLSNRGRTKCDAPGSLAAARFEIVHGKIKSWVQVPVPSGRGTAPVA
jgi:hypothetical protein